jgi:hypothetical protein
VNLRRGSRAVLVNFDSDDDLGVPQPDDRLLSDALLAQSCSTPPDPLRLLQAVDVGTWIVPLFAHGTVSCLVGALFIFLLFLLRILLSSSECYYLC